jgi:prepilin-type N-terminal cleavage/methylation domain-containing protein
VKQIGQKGFSLVELLVTIGIIAVVAAIAIPQLQSYATNSRLKSAARDVMGDIFLCKERAISENRQYRITFNIGGNTYTIEQPPGTVIQTKTPTTFGNDIRITNAAFNGGGTSVTFLTRGTVSGLGGNISLANDRGSAATIRINLTGRTSVEFNLQ